MHVRNDHRRKFSLYAFGHLGLCYGVLFDVICVFTVRRSHGILRDSTVILCLVFYVSNLDTHETREDSVIRTPRTLETHEDFVVSVL